MPYMNHVNIPVTVWHFCKHNRSLASSEAQQVMFSCAENINNSRTNIIIHSAHGSAAA